MADGDENLPVLDEDSTDSSESSCSMIRQEI